MQGCYTIWQHVLCRGANECVGKYSAMACAEILLQQILVVVATIHILRLKAEVGRVLCEH